MMSTATSYTFLGLAIASEILATSALKASDGMTRLLPALVVVAGYAVAFYLLALTLKTMPVGFVYALWSGLGIVGVAIMGALLFGEAFSPLKIAGMGLIVAGILLLNLPTA